MKENVYMQLSVYVFDIDILETEQIATPTSSPLTIRVIEPFEHHNT